MVDTQDAGKDPVQKRMALAKTLAQHLVDTLSATEPVIPAEGMLAGPLRGTVAPESSSQVDWSADNLHFPMDVGNLLRLGPAGIARLSTANAKGLPAEQANYLCSIAATYEAIGEFILAHAETAERQATDATSAERRRLEAIAANCRVLSAEAPETFAHAVQLFWFVHCIRGGLRGEYNVSSTIGRLDQHLFPFCKADRTRKGTTQQTRCRTLS